MESFPEDLNKSEKRIHILTHIYDYVLAIISVICMVLDIWIIIEYFFLHKLIYGIVSTILIGLAHIVLFYAEIVSYMRSDGYYESKMFYFGLFCMVVYFTYLIPIGHFTRSKIQNHFKDEDEEDEKYPQWQFIDNRMTIHSAHFIQHFFQTTSQLIIHIVFLIHYENNHSLFMQIILEISILMSITAISMQLFIELLSWIHSTFTTAIFYWFCVITDIFGLLLIIFYLFQNNNAFFIMKTDNNFYYKLLSWNGYLNIFGQIWMFNYVIFIIPITIISIIGMYFINFIQDIISRKYEQNPFF
eukprot:363663_1